MSSFWKPICNYIHIRKAFASPGKNLKLYIYNFLLYVSTSFKSKKRMSFFSSLRSKKQKASMVVEASIALPFFLFFLANILFSFDMLRLHGNLMAAMHQTGNKMAFYAYAYKSAIKDEIILTDGMDSVIWSEGYARNSVIDILGKEYLDHSCLSSGILGLHFVKSSVMKENEVIELVASYRVKPFIKVMGFPDFPMENRYYGRAWTGYDTAKRQSDMSIEDPIVYVAENGIVYHVARNCSYLNPSVEVIASGMISEFRNESGGKYYACERCSRSGYQAVLYITSQGNKVHGSLKCPGLKRTVYTLHLSEAGGKGKCSKCGGR